MDVARRAFAEKRVLVLGFVLVPIALILGAFAVLFLTLLGVWFGVGGLVLGIALILLFLWWIWATTRGVL